MVYSFGYLSTGARIMILTQLLQFLFPVTFAVDPDCNYYQNMSVGVTYYVYNKEYPGYYGQGKQCRWISIAPQGYVVQVNCQIELPQSPSCNQDRLLISLTGDSNLENAHTYCGFGNITLETQFNNISIGFVSAYNSPGGRFICTLKTKLTSPSCNCGWKGTRRIVGGVETKVNEYPMMAGVVNLRNKDIFCGATIVAAQYAISAAHCYKNLVSSDIAILVGAHNISSLSGAVLHLLDRITSHPLYNGDDPKGRNDIAVLRTQRIIDFNMQVGPACLPFRFYTESFAGQSVEVLGWGTTEFTGPKSDVLLKTDLNVLSYDECSRSMNGTVEQMCTFKQGHDSCQSDSGGPLLWMDSSTIHLHVVGVVSLGFGCATARPGVNTRVTSYLSWITSVTPDAEYCVK